MEKSALMPDIADLLHKVEMSNACLGDMIHDGQKVDDPEVPSWQRKYTVMAALAENLRNAQRELEALKPPAPLKATGSVKACPYGDKQACVTPLAATCRGCPHLYS